MVNYVLMAIIDVIFFYNYIGRVSYYLWHLRTGDGITNQKGHGVVNTYYVYFAHNLLDSRGIPLPRWLLSLFHCGPQWNVLNANALDVHIQSVALVQ